MQRRNLVVAIDGPSGSGKSTVAREVAIALGLRYLDTGAMYRAVTWLALSRDLDLRDAAGTDGASLIGLDLQVEADPRSPAIVADGMDVSLEVRSPAGDAAVSTVSAVPGVRRAMVRRQRAIIGDGGIVVEGRDIGSTVAPGAPVKVFLTADATTRAQRRSRQEGIGDGGARARRTSRPTSADATPRTRSSCGLAAAAGARRGRGGLLGARRRRSRRRRCSSGP